MTMPCSNSLPSVSVESKAWLTKWKDPSDIERVFSPTNWAYVAQNPEKAYFSNCPTIKKYDEVYGEGNAEMWIYAWINQFLKEKYAMKYMSGKRTEAINMHS